MLGNSKQIAELQDKISKLEADLQAATTDKTAIQAELDKASARLVKLKAFEKQVNGHQKSFKALRKALVQANDGEDVKDDEKAEGDEEDPNKDEDPAGKKSKNKAEGEDDETDGGEPENPDARACRLLAAKLTSKASVDKQVTQRLSAAGVDPVKRDLAASEGNDGSKKPDASLPPRQRATAAMRGWGVFAKN